MEKELALYLHIPFCVRKCLYCDFLSYPESAGNGVRTREYLKRLAGEICEEGKAHREWAVSSIFFGGGTPSILPEGEIGSLLGAIRSAFYVKENAEITIECNPGTLTNGKLKEYRDCGIGRLSFGLQSVHEEELKKLGRIHTYKEFLDNYRAARELGFTNINVDLMSALPGQTVASFEETLRCVSGLAPEHISAYSLIIEEGTPFYERYHEKSEELPDEESERRMVRRTGEILEAAGYHRYEISNYAKEGRECRHNLVYWNRGDYLGLGLNAASCVSETRSKNTSDLAAYLNNMPVPKEEEEKLDLPEQRYEAVILGLRLAKGIDLKAYAQRYGEKLQDSHRAWIDAMCADGLMELADGRLFLTERGCDLMNYVLRQFDA